MQHGFSDNGHAEVTAQCINNLKIIIVRREKTSFSPFPNINRMSLEGLG